MCQKRFEDEMSSEEKKEEGEEETELIGVGSFIVQADPNHSDSLENVKGAPYGD